MKHYYADGSLAAHREDARYPKNCRCNICNRVSDKMIASDYGEYVSGPFFPDPKSAGFLCRECYGDYDDIMTGFDMEDQADG